MTAATLGSGAGLQTVELAIRTAMIQLGASLLGQLLATDTGHRGPRIDCGAGHHAEFVGYRDRHLDTVLGRIRVRRAYYHCAIGDQSLPYGIAQSLAEFVDDLGVASRVRPHLLGSRDLPIPNTSARPYPYR